MERDNADETKFQEIVNFNSHAHVERDDTHDLGGMTVEDFNSHAHVERDPVSVRPAITNSISTHTLTWSVTRIP